MDVLNIVLYIFTKVQKRRIYVTIMNHTIIKWKKVLTDDFLIKYEF